MRSLPGGRARPAHRDHCGGHRRQLWGWPRNGTSQHFLSTLLVQNIIVLFYSEESFKNSEVRLLSNCSGSYQPSGKKNLISIFAMLHFELIVTISNCLSLAARYMYWWPKEYLERVNNWVWKNSGRRGHLLAVGQNLPGLPKADVLFVLLWRRDVAFLSKIIKTFCCDFCPPHQLFDGWELNRNIFPASADHVLGLPQRSTYVCDGNDGRKVDS